MLNFDEQGNAVDAGDRRNAGIIGLFVDAKDEAAQSYYERFFVSLEETPPTVPPVTPRSPVMTIVAPI